MKQIKVCVLRSAGTNCNIETAHAFVLAGASPEQIHVNEFFSGKRSFGEFHILALPGGFSYGDDIAAGKILANELKYKLNVQISDFLAQGKLIIGICNGFQVLVKSGLLPGISRQQQQASLIINDCAKFEDRWVYLKPEKSRCVWTGDGDGIMHLPVAHGEGKFVPLDDNVLQALSANRQVVFRYCDAQGACGGYPVNPNGSVGHIAGICDATGRILGLMPHPERNVFNAQSPGWQGKAPDEEGQGLIIFRNGVKYARNNL